MRDLYSTHLRNLTSAKIFAKKRCVNNPATQIKETDHVRYGALEIGVPSIEISSREYNDGRFAGVVAIHDDQNISSVAIWTGWPRNGYS